MEGVGKSSSRPSALLHANQHSQLVHHNQLHQSSSPTFHPKDEALRPASMNQSKDIASLSHDDSMPSTSDFVKKLYKMLEDPAFQSVVSWGPQGDCFVVKDMNEFTKSILPRMFKHSNFASFVRQLNKYDFHKVKNTDDNQFGEHSWTFRHPDFHAERRDALENIKRKVPAQRKAAQAAAAAVAAQAQAQATAAALSALPTLASTSTLLPSPAATIQAQNQLQIDQLQLEIRRLKEEGDDLRGRLRTLERNYESVLVEMVGFQRGMAQQDGLMQSLIAYFLGSENGKLKATNPTSLLNPQSTPSASILPPSSLNFSSPPPQTQQQQQHSSQSQQLNDQNLFLPLNRFLSNVGGANGPRLGSGHESPLDVGRATLMQMSEISRRAGGWNPGGNWGGGGGGDSQSQPQQGSSTQGQGCPSISGMGLTREAALSRIEEICRARLKNSGTSGGGDSQQQQQPQQQQQQWRQESNAAEFGAVSQQNQQGTPSSFWNNLGLSENSSKALAHEGLQVYTVGHLMPRSLTGETSSNWGFDPSSTSSADAAAYGMPSAGSGPSQNGSRSQRFTTAADSQDNNAEGFAERRSTVDNAVGAEDEGDEERVMPSQVNESFHKQPSSSSSTSPSSSSSTAVVSTSKGGSSLSTPASSKSNKLRVRRSTFVPGWAVPPRVLIVDDDIVSRKLGSKFLQVFGCTIDVAVDGVGAVHKMNLEKYDLVLMDIVMPKLDGISATSLIRQFDPMTPIISMTANSKPNEIMNYYSSGMNDILPKPFTQNGLFEMLEKHLRHLKAIQRMGKLPPSIGIPPLSDAHFEQAVTAGAAALASSSQPQPQTEPQTQLHPLAPSSPALSPSDPPTPQSTTVQSPTSPTPPHAPFPGGPGGSSAFAGFGASQGPAQVQPQVQAQGQLQGVDDEGRVNPLSGMGLTDEQYNLILQNIVSGESFLNGTSSSSGGPSTSSSTQQQIAAGMSGTMGVVGMGVGLGMGAGVGMSMAGDKRGFDETGLAGSSGREKRGRFEVVE